VAHPSAGRALMRSTILQYLPGDAPKRYEDSLKDRREALRVEILRRVREMADSVSPHDRKAAEERLINARGRGR
jgi:hypothetical protein